MDLDVLRTCALLHDIGKLACWASGKPWSDHIYYTHQWVSELLGDDYAEIAMRHHTGAGYLEKYHPKSEEERLIWLADNLSSGADRRERPLEGTTRPGPPFKLTHPLSNPDKALTLHKHGYDELNHISEKLFHDLEKAVKGSHSDPPGIYKTVYETLEDSELRKVPADTRPPINDVSLWHHMKLTAAFTTCMQVDGGWMGDAPKDYRFALISGDGDKVSSYILEAKRLPDLNARSERVRIATVEAAEKVKSIVGPECLIFAGGGSILALSPRKLASRVKEEVAVAFYEATGGDLTMTVNVLEEPGDSFQSHFGKVWRKAAKGIRIAKLNTPVEIPEPLEADVNVCDVCGKKLATHFDPMKTLAINASPRPEALCDRCWELRESGRGVWIEDLTAETNYVAVLKADGDDMGLVLDGSRLRELGKAVTPSRLSMLSDLINRTCEGELRLAVQSRGGVVVFAGGDDILAILPGERAPDAAIDMAERFMKAMNGKCTLSRANRDS